MDSLKIKLLFESSLWLVALCLLIGIAYAYLLYQKKATWGKTINWILAAIRGILASILCLLLHNNNRYSSHHIQLENFNQIFDLNPTEIIKKNVHEILLILIKQNVTSEIFRTVCPFKNDKAWFFKSVKVQKKKLTKTKITQPSTEVKIDSERTKKKYNITNKSSLNVNVNMHI